MKRQVARPSGCCTVGAHLTVAVALTAVLTVTASPPAWAVPAAGPVAAAAAVDLGRTGRASVSSTGGQSDEGSFMPELNLTGRYVAFSSSATNLVPGDTNGVEDVFVRDRTGDVTERISVPNAAVQGNGDSWGPSITPDGRYVAFTSEASNLVAHDTNASRDVFVRDRVAGTTTRVSVSGSGAQGNGSSSWGVISADGRHVAFVSGASDLVPGGDTNGAEDIFVRDLDTSVTERVSVAVSGAQSDGHSHDIAISRTGRYVAFSSAAANLVPGDTNGAEDVFIRDRPAGTTTRASVGPGGVQADNDSGGAVLTPDGRHLAFESLATNLVAGGGARGRSVFVRDVRTGVNSRIAVGAEADMSNDGRYVVFASPAEADQYEVYLLDRLTGETTVVSAAAGGAPADGSSEAPAITGNGRVVAFASRATNLVPGDTNDVRDIFARRVRTAS